MYIYEYVTDIYIKLALALDLALAALLRVLIDTPAVYPNFVLNYDFSFFPLKVDQPNLESQNQVINITSRVSQSKFKANRSRGS